MPRCQKPRKFTQLWTLVGPHFRSSVDYRSLRFSSHRGARLIWLGSACRPEWHRRCLHTAPAPSRCSNWLVIRSTWEPTSDFSACSIRGDRTSRFILTHTTVPTSDPVFDGFRWTDSSLRFFLLVRALSEVFRSKFCEQLREMFQQDRLQLHGSHCNNLPYLAHSATSSGNSARTIRSSTPSRLSSAPNLFSPTWPDIPIA